MKQVATLAALLATIGAGAAWAQQAPATPSLGEGHARALLMDYGCSNVSNVSRGKNGWYGQCTKGGRTMDVMVKSDGSVGPAAEADTITEAHARAALMQNGCSNVSNLSHGKSGAWHGNCTKGGTTQFVTVDPQGKVSASTANSITEGHARAALMQFGCSNVSNLNETAEGDWTGQCTKGGQTVNVSVDEKGAPRTR
ncbi:MAG: hypothetical protein JOZ42_03640 [Acetobacteraceae bacterium]|nr:hypothetical protein [Acetobacteraceae bacterium]